MKKDILTLLQQARSDDERDWLVMRLSLDNLAPELREAVWAASIKYKKVLDFYREKGSRSEQAFVL